MTGSIKQKPESKLNIMKTNLAILDFLGLSGDYNITDLELTIGHGKTPTVKVTRYCDSKSFLQKETIPYTIELKKEPNDQN